MVVDHGDVVVTSTGRDVTTELPVGFGLRVWAALPLYHGRSEGSSGERKVDIGVMSSRILLHFLIISTLFQTICTAARNNLQL